MKKMICTALSVLMLASTLVGCASTADAETTPSAANASQDVQYSTPARFSGDWKGIDDTFTVHADAEIELPNISKLVKADVQRANFTQPQADKMMEVFFQGNTFYENIYGTKQSIQAIIDEYEAIVRGEKPYPEDRDGSVERLPDIIAYYTRVLETVPNEWEKPLADSKFHAYQSGNIDYPPDENWQVIAGHAEVDGKKIYCSIENHINGSWRNSAKFWQESYGSENGPVTFHERSSILPEQVVTPPFSAETAEEMGDRLMQALDLETFTLDYIQPIRFRMEDEKGFVFDREIPEDGYAMLYVRRVNSLPLTRTNFDGTSSDEITPAVGSFGYEYIRVYVNEDGVVYFSWESPYTEPEITETDLSLLPFDTIQEIFGRMYFLKNDNWYQINQSNGFPMLHDVNIDKVQLTLMRVRDPFTCGPATIVPVWDFWGTDDWRVEGEEDLGDPPRYEVLMTINALDGSLLDRQLGY